MQLPLNSTSKSNIWLHTPDNIEEKKEDRQNLPDMKCVTPRCHLNTVLKVCQPQTPYVQYEKLLATLNNPKSSTFKNNHKP